MIDIRKFLEKADDLFEEENYCQKFNNKKSCSEKFSE